VAEGEISLTLAGGIFYLVWRAWMEASVQDFLIKNPILGRFYLLFLAGCGIALAIRAARVLSTTLDF